MLKRALGCSDASSRCGLRNHFSDQGLRSIFEDSRWVSLRIADDFAARWSFSFRSHVRQLHRKRIGQRLVTIVPFDKYIRLS